MEESNIMCEIDWKLFIQVMTPLVTLILGTLVAWIALVNVRNNIRMSSSMKWIDDVRNLSSEFINAIYGASTDYNELRLYEEECIEKEINFLNEEKYNNKYVPKVTESLYKIDFLGNKLNMFLDPTDIEQNKILGILYDLRENLDDLTKTKDFKDVNPNKKLVWERLTELMRQLSSVFNNEKEKANRIRIFKY